MTDVDKVLEMSEEELETIIANDLVSKCGISMETALRSAREYIEKVKTYRRMTKMLEDGLVRCVKGE